MRSSRLARLGLGFTLVGMLLALPGMAIADAQDITMSPTSSSPVVNPGSSATGTFEVINQGKVAYPFQVYAAPYHVTGEDYTPDFTVLPHAPNPASWFTFSITKGAVNPGQIATVTYTLHIPKGTQSGGYYAVAFAETKFPQTGNSITLNERVGELFYIEAAGPVVKQGAVTSWVSQILQVPPLEATLRLQNTGSINYPAAIQVAVKDVFGHTKYSLSTDKQVLPHTIRRVPITWAATPSLGIFQVGGTATIFGRTQMLPAKWVLVMSQPVRWAVGGVFVVILLWFVLSSLLARRHRSRSQPPVT